MTSTFVPRSGRWWLVTGTAKLGLAFLLLFTGYWWFAGLAVAGSLVSFFVIPRLVAASEPGRREGEARAIERDLSRSLRKVGARSEDKP